MKTVLCSANTFGAFTGVDSSSPFVKNFVCQPIPNSLKLCRNIAYDQMRLPNLLGHETIEEVKQQAGSWVPLLSKRCHKDLQRLLCSLFSPVCIENSPEPIYPCRSLCEAVKDACEPVMQKVGYPWPDMLSCDKFPQNDMCVPQECHHNCSSYAEPESTVESTNLTIENNIPATTSTPICPACGNELDSETILNLYCAVEFVLKVKIRSVKTSRKDLKLMTEKRKRVIYQQGSLKKKDLRKLTLLIRGGKSCTCPHLEPKGKGKKKKKDFYLVMGGKVGRKLLVSAIYRWPKKLKMLKKLSKKFTPDLCS